MRDENFIRTLRDYSKPSHEGYRNTIELPVGNNMVPLRSDTIRLVQNDAVTMTLVSQQNCNNNNNRNNTHHHQQNRRQEATKAYVAALAEGKVYLGNLPLCNRCKLHHLDQCSVKCRKCERIGNPDGGSSCDEVLKLKNFKKDCYSSSQDKEKYEHVGPKVTSSQEGKISQDDDKRLDLADDLKEAQVHIQVKLKEQAQAYSLKITTHISQDKDKDKDSSLRARLKKFLECRA
ncbi:hypothetical protein Tco_1235939 [Tanacetum coccineum]